MMSKHSQLTALRADADGETLEALVSSSRRLLRFWPQVAAGPEPAAPASVGVRVPSGAQRLVAGMAEYGM
ncbi:hypothetical protein ACIG0C_15465 [Kitasatospora aureofaciens]|uniref:Uncharacterized protein n=2 Tax=Kitasatospora aureofaciens TaxID=1894 RepID=A0A1E7N3L0_KITAU|nr:hypothetical protein [Kitasatospora aureofaciens]QEV01948.1 hypothetical protein CP971_24305 [Streptomyces viridifaciens]ARF80696.1 hypothetical protein B6264_18880 [Kitasatospora aureofaciens]OEV35270.1 hypothetical protein HS99_0032940 [Kitasatospora aureofaciens]GGU61208.1 hypothetical protein GCM10010502_09850 [Kitasatospora aureofaciens]HJD83209.1 hypothetical protein [Kitasatospora aureofaciens]